MSSSLFIKRSAHEHSGRASHLSSDLHGVLLTTGHLHSSHQARQQNKHTYVHVKALFEGADVAHWRVPSQDCSVKEGPGKTG